MTITLRFERSEACAEAHGTDPNEQVTVPSDTSEGEWVQLTYDTLRHQDGKYLAHFSDDGCWLYEGEYWSDIVIEVKP